MKFKHIVRRSETCRTQIVIQGIMMKPKVVQLKNKYLVHYKKLPSNFGAVEKIRLSLGQEQHDRRKKRRIDEFKKNRIIASPCSVTSQKGAPRYYYVIARLYTSI